MAVCWLCSWPCTPQWLLKHCRHLQVCASLEGIEKDGGVRGGGCVCVCCGVAEEVMVEGVRGISLGFVVRGLRTW